MTQSNPVDPPGIAVPNPADDSLTTVIEGRRARDDLGSGQFQAAPDAAILCLTCHHRSPAEDQRADDVDRVEGASDPSDMAIVVPVRCPHCGTTGTLVLRYGPEASADEADLLLALRRRPGERGRP